MSDSLVAFVDVTAQRYTGVAAISLVLYDILITLDKEIQHFWGRSFSLVQLIYFLNRYYGLVVVAIYLYGDMIQVFPDDLIRESRIINSKSPGKRIVQFGAWSGWIMILLSDAIMAIRVHAIFERSAWVSVPFLALFFNYTAWRWLARTATVFLGSLYLAQGIAMMGMLIGYDQRFDEFAWHNLHACGSIAPAWLSTFWIPTLIFELILLCMTLYKAVKHETIATGTSFYRRYSLYRILVRDQVIYFASILLSGCVNIALWKQLSAGTPNNEGITLSVAIPCVLGGRILMSLRGAAAEQDEVMNDSDAEMSSLVFH